MTYEIKDHGTNSKYGQWIRYQSELKINKLVKGVTLFM